MAEIELEEIKRKNELNNGNRNNTDPDNVTPQETNTTTMSEELSIEQVDETMNENQDAWYTIKEPLDEEDNTFFERLVTLMVSIEGNEIPQMINVDKKFLLGASTKVDAMFKKIILNNINTLGKVMYCGGIINSRVTRRKNSKGKQNS